MKPRWHHKTPRREERLGSVEWEIRAVLERKREVKKNERRLERERNKTERISNNIYIYIYFTFELQCTAKSSYAQ